MLCATCLNFTVPGWSVAITYCTCFTSSGIVSDCSWLVAITWTRPTVSLLFTSPSRVTCTTPALAALSFSS
uniref:Putative secreted protein n=1 Tax=Anopheles darlingi TaxID=43151 RepID=A0A2M4D3J1_ANODA